MKFDLLMWWTHACFSREKYFKFEPKIVQKLHVADFSYTKIKFLHSKHFQVQARNFSISLLLFCGLCNWKIISHFVRVKKNEINREREKEKRHSVVLQSFIASILPFHLRPDVQWLLFCAILFLFEAHLIIVE